MIQVEVFDERELNPETLKVECDTEALALIEELGLKLQRDESSGTRIHYPNPTEQQRFVMQALFPTSTPIDKYDAGMIPLRVLKEIRSYKAEYPDHLLLIRHAPPVVVSDPILIAWTGEKMSWYWDNADAQANKMRLIARWGDALESWPKLYHDAQIAATKAYDDALASIQAQVQVARAKIAAGVKVTTVNTPSMSIII